MRKVYRAGHLLLAGLAAAACTPTWERLDLASLPPAPQGPQAELLLDETTVDFPLSPTGARVEDVRTHKQIRLLQESARPWLLLSVSYTPGWGDLVALRARAVFPDGTQKTWERPDAADGPAFPSFMLYSETRAASLDLRDVPLGSVVELDYTIRVTQRTGVFNNVTHPFDTSIPSRLSRLVITAPSGATLLSVARRGNERVDFAPEHRQDGRDEVWTWERHDLPALADEAGAPDVDFRQLRVSASVKSMSGIEELPSGDARTLSAWSYRFVEPAHVATPGLRAQVEKITAGTDPSPEARVRRLYEWVRDNIGYAAVVDAANENMPLHAAAEVLRVGYGDCKDKANLLRTMLDVLNISSDLLMTSAQTGVRLRLMESYESDVFNHAILRVNLPAGPLYLDPTSRFTPFGALPPEDQDADILPITPEGAELARAPASTPRENTSEVALSLKVDSHGQGTGDLTLAATGTTADYYRREAGQAAASEEARVIMRLSGMSVPRAKKVTAPDREHLFDPTFKAGGTVTMSDVISEGPIRLIRFSRFVIQAFNPLRDSARSTPLYLGRPRRVHHHVTCALPEGLIPSVIPPPVHLEAPAFSYDLTWSLRGNVLEADRVYVIKQTTIEPGEYAAARVVVERMNRAEEEAVLVGSASVATP
jgi:hypothetical protein